MNIWVDLERPVRTSIITPAVDKIVCKKNRGGGLNDQGFFFTIIFISKPLTIEPPFFMHNILFTAGVQCVLRMYLFTYLNDKHMQIIYHSKDITALQWSVS